ncbi:hypothetical protein HDU88_003476 [Geranomyces variabilis]|nr:hypothetical protein HDU88_003476 [Geranomyces variabilis]
MTILGIYVVALAVAGAAAASEGTLATVFVTGGPLTGKANDAGNYEFLGVRYAQAARWEAPTGVTPWTAAIDAVAFQRSCPQICQSVLCPEVIGEDCLFLNIYTAVGDAATLKTTASGVATASRPVVVFFHGGSFDEGGAGMAAYDGGELAASIGAVVVTFNYRLGVFGYFDIAAVDSTATSAINFGILDQRFAIEWVQDNIAAFGGDPTKVTYLGQSAGAQSILLHMAHPATAEMITNVVLMSPPALAFTTKAKAQTSALSVARHLGCADLACMRAKTMRQVLAAKVADTGTAMQALSQIVYREMSPVVDGVDILMNPFEVLATPQVVQRARIMLGGVSNETALFVNETNPGSLSSPLFNVIIDGVFSPNTDAVSQLYGSTSEGYLVSRKPHLVRIISDWIFTCPQRQSVRAATASASSIGRVWSYYLEAPWLGGTDEAMGDMCANMACHTTDLSYLFRTPDDVPSQAVTEAFRAYLAAFIAGSTTLAPTGYPTWTTASSDPARYPILRFPAPVSSAMYAPSLEPTHPLASRCDLWDAAGYEYATLTNPATISQNKQAAAALSLIPLAATLGVLVLFVLTEWALVTFGTLFRQRLARLFRAIEEDTQDLEDAVKQLRTQQDLLACVPGAPAVQVGLLGKLTEAVSQSIESLNEEEKPNPVLVACCSVTYRAGDMDGAKRLLDDVNVAFLPGTVTAIMGPSGAGKTTLLSLLNRRLKAGSSVEDRIYFSGKPLSSMTAARFRAMTGLVAQHDAPYYGLTVREVMMFNAMLELPSSLPRVEKVRRINHLLRILNLLPCADVVIQKPESNLGGISGGQMRRLSIAVALLKRPSVLFMDEPTSGLDAKSSMDVGKAMTHLASQGYTIICSIHQPRPEMFAMFDQVIVLVYGRLLFAGKPEDTVQHFQELRTKLAVRNNDASIAASHYGDVEEPVGVETNETGSVLVKRFRHEDEKDGEGPNPADLVLDVASTILIKDVAWAARQRQPPEIDIEAIPLSSKKVLPTSPVMTSRTANNNATVDEGMHRSFTPLPPPPPENSTEMINSTVNKALKIASKYVAVEDGKLIVPVRPSTRRVSDSILYESPAKRLSVLRRVAELSPVEQMESGSGRGYPHTTSARVLPPDGAESQAVFPDPPASSVVLAAGAATAGRLSLPAQVTVLTGRWWTTRPLARKFNMMIISAGGVWILSLLQRRSGDDVLSLVLQTKGLALGKRSERCQQHASLFIIACIGLPALKNIHISFDYYEDRDIYNFDSQNGTVTALAFFLHRVVYETANATVEGFIAVTSAYFILGCNPDPYRIGTAMSLFVAYYNCTTTLFTLVYCTRLGRPEARSVAFFSQAVLAIVSGVWIKKGDATVYDWIAWAQYLNPTYWALSPLVRANAAHAGECLLENAGYCQASMGDVVAEEARADCISPREGMLALGVIWLAMRALQLLLLYRDTYWAAFWGSVKKGWADWVRAQMTRATTVAVHETQTGASLEKMPDTYDHIGVKGNMVELDKDVA